MLLRNVDLMRWEVGKIVRHFQDSAVMVLASVITCRSTKRGFCSGVVSNKNQIADDLPLSLYYKIKPARSRQFMRFLKPIAFGSLTIFLFFFHLNHFCNMWVWWYKAELCNIGWITWKTFWGRLAFNCVNEFQRKRLSDLPPLGYSDLGLVTLHKAFFSLIAHARCVFLNGKQQSSIHHTHPDKVLCSLAFFIIIILQEIVC